MIGSNVFGQAQQYQTQAGNIYGQLGQFQAPTLQAVGRVGQPMQAGQIATTDLSQYTSPYMQQVIDPVTQQIERQRLLAQEQLEAQATRAGAFGARRDLERDRLAEEAMRQTAQAVSPLYQQAFTQALGAAQYDIGQQRAADLAEQQALEAAAQREQAARVANVEGAYRGAGIQQSGASGLSSLGQTMFGQGMSGLAQQQRAAALAQQQQQQMLDAARQQTLANLGYPQQALQTGSGILQGLPSNKITQSGSPGLFDILTGIGSLPGFG